MIISTYSLDSVVEPLKKIIREATYEGGGRIWNDELKVTYWDGDRLVKNFLGDWSIEKPDEPQLTRSPKMSFYIEQAIKKGMSSTLSGYKEPLAACIYVINSHLIAHDDWLSLKIYDIGRVRGALEGTDPDIYLQYLPENARMMALMQRQMNPQLMKREFEILPNGCFEQCAPVKCTWDACSRALEAISKL